MQGVLRYGAKKDGSTCVHRRTLGLSAAVVRLLNMRESSLKTGFISWVCCLVQTIADHNRSLPAAHLEETFLDSTPFARRLCTL